MGQTVALDIMAFGPGRFWLTLFGFACASGPTIEPFESIRNPEDRGRTGEAFTNLLSIFEEKTVVVNPVSGCENAGQEHAYRCQHKCPDQGERRHTGINLPADATTAATAGPLTHQLAWQPPPWLFGPQGSLAIFPP
jgi:hypothetical protein